MSHSAKIEKRGYQPGKHEVTKGYPVTQPVDLNNLKIPKNLGDAAVTPPNSGNPAPAPTGPKKE
jgi:hypothetical protein